MLSFYTVFCAGSVFLRILRGAIFVYVILSWFRPNNRLFYALERFVAPFVQPFRRLSVWITAKTRIPLDFSCWFAMIGISIINELWWKLYQIL